MAKGTIIFLFVLAVLASLLFGIKLGINLDQGKTAPIQSTVSNPPPLPSPTFSLPSPVSSSSAVPTKKVTSLSTFQNGTCGFSFSYPGSFMRQKTENEQSVIFTDPDDPKAMIAATCAQTLPRPPVSSDKIESITLGGVPATLYHDQDTNGNPRDEVIVKHPSSGLEIILAGYGETFQAALSSFKFVQ
jgi:hypothetical protein